MKTAIYPGSFDPITLGHLNIIKRAAVCFDKLIVCVMVNSEKVNRGLFTPEERVVLIRRVVAKLPNVEADCSSTLIAEYARQKRACTLVKGLRAVSDYENELQMALINRKLNPRLETMFLPSSAKYTYVSSSMVKEMARYGAELSDFVPREIIGEGWLMATGVEELLDMLFEMIDEAKSMPLSSDKCILERDKALDLLDEIRAQFPMELAEAKKLIAARTEYIASAKREGELIRKQAEEKARQMVSEDELLAQTKQKANELMRTAEERSRDLRKAANDYCEDALRRTEEAVAEAYDEIKKSRARFRALAGGGAPAGRQPYDVEAE